MALDSMSSKFISTLLFGLSVGLSLDGAMATVAAPRTLSSGDGKVEFLAIGRPGFLKVKGEGAKPKGSVKIVDGKASGEFTVELSQFKTGIELRDEHMKEKYLKVGTHPTAVIRFSDIELKSGAGKTVVPAELELHGTKKPVSLEAKLDGLAVEATFKIKLTDFGIAIPSYAGVTVAEDVSITVGSTLSESL